MKNTGRDLGLGHEAHPLLGHRVRDIASGTKGQLMAVVREEVATRTGPRWTRRAYIRPEAANYRPPWATLNPSKRPDRFAPGDGGPRGAPPSVGMRTVGLDTSKGSVTRATDPFGRRGRRASGVRPGRSQPEPLAALLVEMAERLIVTAEGAPLAALRAAGMLKRIAARVGREAAGVLCDDGLAREAVATGLGTTYSKALVMLLAAQDR
ncbi:hypothetical protein Snoj_00820 [Streptomyces nojiriensis]|uniref:Uncharacterized protein n=1 Tax=Streptomyces nojiriensis TaxID=66374 RepID=A0ABQ3SDG5_9ACTN|nr:hypothetical protein [Streptomyces nojiriensis]QTI42307.1 hypothetical protein JYK04_00064 [Streptomyces nojiriensis]GGS34595.1 hypothetical protein GCM10010205_75970 [Streptomyces nojiriensis]GHI66164.1 hypothetical protein Snoj_00820 [Streptomyces nojiriensis]